MMEFFFWTAVSSVVATVFCSFFEWALHRYLMHRPVGPFTYPFRAHALVHHRIFRADHSYHLCDEKDKHTIPMAWWNGPVLIMIGLIPFTAAAWYFAEWGLLAGAALTFSGYYGVYEYLHWCMHLPRKRGLERSGLFFRLNGHHILHHRYMHKNFNVVLPLADFCLGTLIVRSKIRFAQPVGPSVPDVQPLDEPQPFLRRLFRFLRLCLTGVQRS
jgi:hypothetical protein